MLSSSSIVSLPNDILQEHLVNFLDAQSLSALTYSCKALCNCLNNNSPQWMWQNLCKRDQVHTLSVSPLFKKEAKAFNNENSVPMDWKQFYHEQLYKWQFDLPLFYHQSADEPLSQQKHHTLLLHPDASLYTNKQFPRTFTNTLLQGEFVLRSPSNDDLSQASFSTMQPFSLHRNYFEVQVKYSQLRTGVTIGCSTVNFRRDHECTTVGTCRTCLNIGFNYRGIVFCGKSFFVNAPPIDSDDCIGLHCIQGHVATKMLASLGTEKDANSSTITATSTAPVQSASGLLTANKGTVISIAGTSSNKKVVTNTGATTNSNSTSDKQQGHNYTTCIIAMYKNKEYVASFALENPNNEELYPTVSIPRGCMVALTNHKFPPENRMYTDALQM